MGQMASGYAEMQMKKTPPEELIENIKDCYSEFYYCAGTLTFSIDGNYWFSNVLDDLRSLAPYVENGHVGFHGDEDGECRAEFVNGAWMDEYVIEVFPSELPTREVFSTARAAQLINYLLDEALVAAEPDYAAEVLKACNFTEKEKEVLRLKEI